MHGRWIELEYFRVLLKYQGGHGLSPSSVLVHGIRSRPGFPAAIRQLVPIRFCSRQAHSFLHLAMCRDAGPALLIPYVLLSFHKDTGPNQLLR